MWIFLLFLSSFLLAAHFFRIGLLLLTIISLLIIPLAFVRNKASYITLQIIIFLGTIDWVRTLIRIVRERIHQEKPWFIAFLILGVIICLNIYTLLTLRKEKTKKLFIKK